MGNFMCTVAEIRISARSAERTQSCLPIVCSTIAVAVFSAAFAFSASAQSYRLERIASGLDQPTYITQAPGDPANILYYSTRVTTGNTMGSVWRYNTDTRVATEVMNLSHRGVSLDLGLVGFAFHPDYNTPGTDGYQKLYVSTASDNGGQPPINRVEEYAVSAPGFKVPVNGSNQPVVNKVVLQYNNVISADNHTIDWIGFNPAEPVQPGDAQRNYLYVVTGDGSNGQPAQNRPEQKADSLLGKMLRLDVGGGDAYPADPLKNFAIPATNPIPLWNSMHDGNNQLVSSTITYNGAPGTVTYGEALPEIYFTGLRNTFGMGFDRLTGDWYGGDVGENSREEINFMKVNTYDGTQPPRDFGYPQREGTNSGASNSIGATTLQWDLSDGGSVISTSVNPIREGAHANLNAGSTSADDEIRSSGRSSYIGGYVYRGPIEELQGQYIYTDFVHGNIFALDFDRDTPLASYSGTNLNRAAEPGGTQQVASLGTRTVVANRNVDSLWQSLIVDPSDPSYVPSVGDTNKQFGIGRVVNFGEDNAGNLYIIDFGGDRDNHNFGNDYPPLGRGEIFRLVPNLLLNVTVNRDTGEMTFTNASGGAVDVRGYSINSANGAINSANFTPVTGRLDAFPNGNGDIDPNNFWEITSAGGDKSEFSEQSTGTETTLGNGAGFELSPGGGWIQSIYEDLTLTVTLGDGSQEFGIVTFVDSGPNEPFARSDLNFNRTLDAGDWDIFKGNHGHIPGGLSLAEAYGLGDLDGDGDNDFFDFRIFQEDYILANGEAAFANLFNAVPEPGSLILAGMALTGVVFRRRRTRRGLVGMTRSVRGEQLALPKKSLVALAILMMFQASANADLTHRYSFNLPGLAEDSVGDADGTLMNGATVSGGLLNLTNTGGGQSTQHLSLLANGPNGINIATYNALTIEMWATTTNTNDWVRYFDIGSHNINGDGSEGGNAGNSIWATVDGGGGNTMRMAISNVNLNTLPSQSGFNSELQFNVSPNQESPTNVEHHIAFVFDDANNTGAIYLNGQPLGTNTNGGPLTHTLALLQDNGVLPGLPDYALIGASLYNDPGWSGSFNEVRLYNQALNAGDVMARYIAGPDVVAGSLFELEVNTFTGDVVIKNSSGQQLAIDYYQVTSPNNALSPGTWNSLDSQNVDADGPGVGHSWDEGGDPSTSTVTELYMRGASNIAPDDTRELGQLFDPSVFGKRQDGDLEFRFALQGSNSLITGDVIYITPPPLLGDYNDDGFVNAADYTVYRNRKSGIGGTTLVNDAGAPGVTIDDYNYWKAHYGETLFGSGAAVESQNVPEPSSALLLVVGMLAAASIQGVKRGARVSA